MCGIVGYTGRGKAARILLQGLAKLEYRGYDSAGLAVRDGEEPIKVVKAVGKLKNLAEKTEQGESMPGSCGIGHTRWATHGEPNEKNAHPHISGDYEEELTEMTDCAVVGVHNGIIENCDELKEKLLRHGYQFYSDTDTEVVIKLVDYYYKKYKIGPIDAVNRMMVRVRGSYALALLFKDYPGEIYAARKDSPMIIGTKEGEAFLASDATAIIGYTRNVYYIGNLQSARILPGEVHFFDLNGDEIRIPSTEITWEAKAAEKNGYEHFMLKEIHEEPTAVKDTWQSLLKDGKIDLSSAGLTDETIREISSLHIVACGSAWHVGVAAQYLFEELAGVSVRVELASEFRYRKLLLHPKALVILISQSGETADTLEALRIAKSKGVRTLGIVNVVGSTIAREADAVLYTKAGPEIAVATTKAYAAQLVTVYAMATQFAMARGTIDAAEYAECIARISDLPKQIKEILDDKKHIQWLASKFSHAKDVFFIGRGADYAVSLEGSLKMKEISYIHSEAYAAGEMKHGTISLIENGTLVVGVLTQNELKEKTLSNLKECKARGAYLAGVIEEGDEALEDQLDFFLCVPRTDPRFAGLLAVIPLQLLGYYVSVSKGLDVDKPRNLAKSVTVE